MPDSKAQVRWAHACEGGYVRGGCDKNFAREVISKTHGKKLSSLPEHKRKKKQREGYKGSWNRWTQKH